jgi:WD40 repeat protein
MFTSHPCSHDAFALCLLPDGKLVCGGSNTRGGLFEGSMSLWDTKTWTEGGSFPQETHTVHSIVPLSDGTLVSGHSNGQMIQWDVAHPNATLSIPDSNSFLKIATLPNGRVAGANVDGTLLVWNPATGATTTLFAKTDNSLLQTLATSSLHEGKLAMGSIKGNLEVLDLAAPAAAPVLLEKSSSTIAELLFLPDGRLASGDMLNDVKLWDLRARSCTATLKTEAHGCWITALCASDRFPYELASRHAGSQIQLWDLRMNRVSVETCANSSGFEMVRLDNGLIVMTDERAGADVDVEDVGCLSVWDPDYGYRMRSHARCKDIKEDLMRAAWNPERLGAEWLIYDMVE